MKDANGFNIVVGCLVAWHEYGAERKGWLKEVRSDGVGVVIEESTGGRRLVRMKHLSVKKPTVFQKAKEVGDGKSIKHTNETARKRRLVRRKEK